MKECWINVYRDWSDYPCVGIWYGDPQSKPLKFHNKVNENGLLYRIHVRLK